MNNINLPLIKEHCLELYENNTHRFRHSVTIQSYHNDNSTKILLVPLNFEQHCNAPFKYRIMP